MYRYTETYTKKLSLTSLCVSKCDVKLGWASKFSNLLQVGDFAIFGSKSSHVQFVIFDYAPTFSVRGPAPQALRRARSASLRMDGMGGDGISKVYFNFLYTL